MVGKNKSNGFIFYNAHLKEKYEQFDEKIKCIVVE